MGYCGPKKKKAATWLAPKTDLTKIKPYTGGKIQTGVVVKGGPITNDEEALTYLPKDATSIDKGNFIEIWQGEDLKK